MRAFRGHRYSFSVTFSNLSRPIAAWVEIIMSEKLGLVGRKIRNARHIDGDNADRTRALAGAEVAAGLLAKLAQVKAQAAAHAADV